MNQSGLVVFPNAHLYSDACACVHCAAFRLQRQHGDVEKAARLDRQRRRRAAKASAPIAAESSC